MVQNRAAEKNPKPVLTKKSVDNGHFSEELSKINPEITLNYECGKMHVDPKLKYC